MNFIIAGSQFVTTTNTFWELEHLLVERQRMVSEVISEYLISKIFLHDLATQFTTTQISWAEP